MFEGLHHRANTHQAKESNREDNSQLESLITKVYY